MPNITSETRVLLAVLATAASSEQHADSEVCKVLDRKLGAGWSLDLLNARSDEERVDVLNRRLRLVGDYHRTHLDSVQQQTAHEDGGAR